MRSPLTRCQSTPVPRGVRRQRGFSMFEMVVYILAASILFAAAFNRYRDFPGEAERANFTAILAQLNATVNLQMMRLIASGTWNDAGQMEGRNPMDWLLTAPGNYVGAFAGIDEATLPRRIWYFDTSRGQLVYLADDASNLYLLQNGQRIATDSIRFGISNVYGSDAGSAGGNWQGIVLAPVVPYEWQAVELELQTIQP
ncbi:MAG: type II secretion system protein [Pseudohongiella sp.]|uniref:type II secretion system protein n=1 Tax=Pseudohongiella sp. TaxID=1979412 RepID=UPI0034A02616